MSGLHERGLYDSDKSVIKIIEKDFATHKPLIVQRGLLHDYLGMTIDFSIKKG